MKEAAGTAFTALVLCVMSVTKLIQHHRRQHRRRSWKNVQLQLQLVGFWILMLKTRRQAATCIQAQVRGYLARRSYKTWRKVSGTLISVGDLSIEISQKHIYGIVDTILDSMYTAVQYSKPMVILPGIIPPTSVWIWKETDGLDFSMIYTNVYDATVSMHEEILTCANNDSSLEALRVGQLEFQETIEQNKVRRILQEFIENEDLIIENIVFDLGGKKYELDLRKVCKAVNYMIVQLRNVTDNKRLGYNLPLLLKNDACEHNACEHNACEHEEQSDECIEKHTTEQKTTSTNAQKHWHAFFIALAADRVFARKLQELRKRERLSVEIGTENEIPTPCSSEHSSSSQLSSETNSQSSQWTENSSDALPPPPPSSPPSSSRSFSPPRRMSRKSSWCLRNRRLQCSVVGHEQIVEQPSNNTQQGTSHGALKTHTEYTIECKLVHENSEPTRVWRIRRRFRDFKELHHSIKKCSSSSPLGRSKTSRLPHFADRHHLATLFKQDKKESFLNRREKELEKYISHMLDDLPADENAERYMTQFFELESKVISYV